MTELIGGQCAACNRALLVKDDGEPTVCDDCKREERVKERAREQRQAEHPAGPATEKAERG